MKDFEIDDCLNNVVKLVIKKTEKLQERPITTLFFFSEEEVNIKALTVDEPQHIGNLYNLIKNWYKQIQIETPELEVFPVVFLLLSINDDILVWGMDKTGIKNFARIVFEHELLANKAQINTIYCSKFSPNIAPYPLPPSFW